LLDDVLYFAGDDRRLALIDFTEGLSTGEFAEYQVSVTTNALPLKAALVWTDYPGHVGSGIQLVNDLNLLADNGSEIFLGNVYENGQSVPGGDADDRNVEECIRRENPEPGIWNFRVEALTAPFGPQPFALVVTGGLGGFVGGAGEDGPLAEYALRACAPNPFRQQTTLHFDLPVTSQVAVSIHDVTGRRVRALLEGAVPAGRRSVVWDGRDGLGRQVCSGVYVCRLRANRFHESVAVTVAR
jgi:hypothetical protein